MATLELQFNCLCLFVPDAEERVVHVLMPGTNGHEGHEGHDGHAGHHKHVVRMLHHGFEGGEKLKGRDMEGWALTIGRENAPADAWTDLLPPRDAVSDGELPDLSKITGKPVHPALLGKKPNSKVAARITLRSGRVTRITSEAKWKIDRDEFALAHQVTWEMDARSVLSWEGLNGKPDGDPKPLEKLEDLEPEDDLGYKLRIFHVTEDALPPRGGMLHPAEMRAHFGAFYPLVGEDFPKDALLPRMISRSSVEVNCGAAKGAPPPGG
jgi:hypothetical protein